MYFHFLIGQPCMFGMSIQVINISHSTHGDIRRSHVDVHRQLRHGYDYPTWCSSSVETICVPLREPFGYYLTRTCTSMSRHAVSDILHIRIREHSDRDRTRNGIVENQLQTVITYKYPSQIRSDQRSYIRGPDPSSRNYIFSLEYAYTVGFSREILD